MHETEAVRSGVTGYVIHGTEFIWTTPEKVLRKKSGGGGTLRGGRFCKKIGQENSANSIK